MATLTSSIILLTMPCLTMPLPACPPACLPARLPARLQEDPNEATDLALDPAYKTRLTSMISSLARLNTTLFQPQRGQQQLAACDRGIDEGGYYGPWIDLEGTREGGVYYVGIRAPDWKQKAKNAALRKELEEWNKATAIERDIFKKVVQARYKQVQRPLDSCIPAA